MPNSLPHVGPRQAYVEVYFTHATADDTISFSQVTCGDRKPVGGSALESSAAAIRRRVIEAIGKPVRLNPLLPHVTTPRIAAVGHAPRSASEVEGWVPCCIVTAIVKTPLGVRASSHVESVATTQRAHYVSATPQTSLVTRGTQVGVPSHPTDFTKDWSVRARNVEIGQHSYINLMSFFIPAQRSCRSTSSTRPLLSFDLVSRHHVLTDIDPSIRVLDRTDAQFDRRIRAGHDIVTDMELLTTPTIATAFMTSSTALVSEAENRKSKYQVTGPWF